MICTIAKQYVSLSDDARQETIFLCENDKIKVFGIKTDSFDSFFFINCIDDLKEW